MFHYHISKWVHKLSVPPQLLPAHLSELALPQLLPEDQLLPWELGSRDVLPGQRVDGEGGHGVHVAAGDPLQADDVGLGVVRCVAMETLMRRALGNVGLSVASSTRCWKKEGFVYELLSRSSEISFLGSCTLFCTLPFPMLSSYQNKSFFYRMTTKGSQDWENKGGFDRKPSNVSVCTKILGLHVKIKYNPTILCRLSILKDQLNYLLKF